MAELIERQAAIDAVTAVYVRTAGVQDTGTCLGNEGSYTKAPRYRGADELDQRRR